MPVPTNIRSLANRSTEQSRVPIQKFQLPPYPAVVVKRFPEMVEFRRLENQMLADFIKTLNVAQQG